MTNTPVLRDATIHAALVSTTEAAQLEHFEEFVAMAEAGAPDMGERGSRSG